MRRFSRCIRLARISVRENKMKFIKTVSILLMIVAISLASEEKIKVGNRKFSIKLFKEIRKDNPNGNIIFSPLTVQILMGVLTSATKIFGPGIREVIDVAELPLKKTTRETTFKNLIKGFQKDDDFKIFNSNRIYLGSGATVQDWFTTNALDIYNADIKIIDFRDSRNASDEINNWVTEETNNKITNFIQPDQITDQTKVLMINALYLMGKWEKSFDPLRTENDTFLGTTDLITVQMMKTSKKTYHYFEDDNFQYLQFDLAKKGGGAEVVFVLPLLRSGVGSVIEENLEEALSPHKFYVVEAKVSLPKFKINNDIPLKDILKRLGITKIFTRSGVILEGYHFGGQIFKTVSDIFQKAFIQVDETGVTVTSTGGAIGYIDTAPKYKEFIADHPFLFYIRVSGIIVYAGQVMEPNF